MHAERLSTLHWTFREYRPGPMLYRRRAGTMPAILMIRTVVASTRYGSIHTARQCGRIAPKAISGIIGATCLIRPGSTAISEQACLTRKKLPNRQSAWAGQAMIGEGKQVRDGISCCCDPRISACLRENSCHRRLPPRWPAPRQVAMLPMLLLGLSKVGWATNEPIPL
jgi:hypothetical protein